MGLCIIFHFLLIVSPVSCSDDGRVKPIHCQLFGGIRQEFSLFLTVNYTNIVDRNPPTPLYS